MTHRRVVEMDTTLGRVILRKPGEEKEEPKVFTFDSVYDWKLVFLNLD